MTKEFCLHRIFLIAICTFSFGITAFPTLGEGSFSALLLSFAITVPVYLLLNKLKNSKVLLIIVSALCMVFAAAQIDVLTDFFAAKVLKNTPAFWIAAVFAVAVIYAALAESAALLKFSLICLPLIAFTVLLIFVLSFDKFDFSNVLFYIYPSKESFLSQTLKYTAAFLPACLFPFYQDEAPKSLKNDLLGLLLGALVFILCFWNVGLVFTSGGNFRFAYFYTVDALSVGSIFTRLSGLIYFVFFAVSFVKVSALIQTVGPLYRNFKFKMRRMITALTVIFAVLLSLLF